MLYQNDDFGKEYLSGLKGGLGADHAGMIVKEVSYETSEPTVDSQVVTLQGSGADILLIAATPKFAAQAIRKSYDLGWNGVRYVTNVSVSVTTILKPAGLEKSKGLITAYYGKDPTDPRWKDDPGMKEWAAFVGKYMSPKELNDANASYAFGAAQTMMQVLKQCGNDLSRDNVIKQAANLRDLELPLFAARDEDQHVSDQLQPHPPDAARKLRRPKLAIVRRAVDRLSGSRAMRSLQRAALASYDAASCRRWSLTKFVQPPDRTSRRPRRRGCDDGAPTRPGSDRMGHGAAIPSSPP